MNETGTVYESLTDPEQYCDNFIKIRTKAGKIERLRLNEAQKVVFGKFRTAKKEKRPLRLVILKARQLGMSTGIEALFFAQTATRANARTAIIAHDADSTAHLFRMNRLFYDELPPIVKPMRKNSNAQEIVFENPETDAAEKRKNPGLRSSIRCLTAGGSGVGRGDTLTMVHASEAAFWPRMEETLDGLLQAVPGEAGTAVIIETTPNGYNAFKSFWDNAVSGKNGFEPVFFPWFTEAGYRKPVPPGRVWTQKEITLQKTFGLDEEQLEWRRWCIDANLRGDEFKFRQEYPATPEEAFLASGTPYFDADKIHGRLAEIRTREEKKIRFLYAEDAALRPEEWSAREERDGETEIFEAPTEREPYVIGADTAGDGSDRFTAVVLNNRTGRQAAALCYDGGSELYFVQQLFCLGRFYNNALIAVEINFSSYPERKLEEWGYPNLYIREKPDDAARELNGRKLGWRTDARTRPLALANLQTIVHETPELIEDAELLREMLTFQRNRDMRPEAAEGQHDDRVLAAAIAFSAREQQRSVPLPPPQSRRKKLTEKYKTIKEL